MECLDTSPRDASICLYLERVMRQRQKTLAPLLPHPHTGAPHRLGTLCRAKHCSRLGIDYLCPTSYYRVDPLQATRLIARPRGYASCYVKKRRAKQV